VIPRFGKASVRYAAMEITIVTQATKEGVQHDLLGCTAHGQQGGDQTWQRQLARAGEGVWK
jgi:hypothetical protein